MRIVFSEAAKASLREIALFIARDNKQRARSFVRELQDSARELTRMPLAFPLVPRFERHGIRRRSYRGYLIFYQVEEKQIVIVDILHGARDVETLLSETP